MAQNSEFIVEGAKQFNQSSAVAWGLSHITRYKLLLIIALFSLVLGYGAQAQVPILYGQATESFLSPDLRPELVRISLTILALLVGQGLLNLAGAFVIEVIGQRFEANAREELYISLLGKSQTFHDRQRVGDIMARATDDVKQLNFAINPGMRFILATILGILAPVIMIFTIDFRLALVPGLFIVTYVLSVGGYLQRLGPIIGRQRVEFGKMNTSLEETISGIEVVKASAQESIERDKFVGNARSFRDSFVQQGQTEARYLPLLLYGVALGATFIHAAFLFSRDIIQIGDVIAVLALMELLRFPTFASVFSFSLVQLGLKSADRILDIIKSETELDQNIGGHQAPVKGRITFENVSFAYEEGKPVLQELSFEVEPGQTVAIVGQTGSGKSTLTELINRTYDVDSGRVLIDGVDVREWNLDSLRSQISRIEQDVFLFSRSLSQNIAFGAPGIPQAQIETAAKQAQAHDFIVHFKDGYATEVGDRGVTLSGGQRQRIAIARAFLSDPRILILDDSTSAIDSATEDRIQEAIRNIQQGRTTLLITHRLSQIRWADTILVLDAGKIAASGTHDELLRTSLLYRRIFARYETSLPPLGTSEAV